MYRLLTALLILVTIRLETKTSKHLSKFLFKNRIEVFGIDCSLKMVKISIDEDNRTNQRAEIFGTKAEELGDISENEESGVVNLRTEGG